MFICVYPENGKYAKGNSLAGAFKELQDDYDNEDATVEDCEFYEVGQCLDVEVKIVRKEVPVKVTAPKAPAAKLPNRSKG